MDISWQVECKNHEIPAQDFFQRCLKQAVKTDNTNITLRFVEKNESQQLNHQFRNKNNPTNVLSFPDQPIPGEQEAELGALVFCPEIINAEAKDADVDLSAYWAHMIIHGCLHLLGFTHDTDASAEKMESLEVSILNKLGYPNPYA